MTIKIIKRELFGFPTGQALRITLNKRELDTIQRAQQIADVIREKSQDLIGIDEADESLSQDWCTVDVGCSEVIQAGNVIEYPIS